MADSFNLGPISVERGTRGYGTLPVTTMSTGFDIEIPVHIIAGSGSRTGPTVTLAPMLHGHEYTVIDVVSEILKLVDPKELVGNIIAMTVANPIAFQMGTRASWFDGLWGPINDLNRAFPGDDRGWIVERIAHVISEYIIPVSDIVIDFHGEATNRFGASYYAYLFKTDGKLGEKTDEFTYDLGLEIVVNCAQPQPNTLVGYARSRGKVGLAVELCDFYGLEGEPRTDIPKLSATQAGVTCVLNTLKKLGMIGGELELPRKQVVLEGGYVGVAPSHGGLLCPEVTRKDIGRVFRKGQNLGTVISPYTFQVLDKLQMPFEETMVLAVKDNLPFTHIEPGAGDIGFEVCDWNEKRWIVRSEGKGGRD